MSNVVGSSRLIDRKEDTDVAGYESKGEIDR